MSAIKSKSKASKKAKKAAQSAVAPILAPSPLVQQNPAPAVQLPAPAVPSPLVAAAPVPSPIASPAALPASVVSHLSFDDCDMDDDESDLTQEAQGDKVVAQIPPALDDAEEYDSDAVAIYSRIGDTNDWSWGNREGYLELIKRPLMWLGTIEIFALAAVLKTTITLHTNAEKPQVFCPDLSRDNDTDPLSIYHDKGHFKRLIGHELVNVRGCGDCLLLVAATYTKALTLLHAKRDNGKPTNSRKLGVEETEANRLRKLVCDEVYCDPDLFGAIATTGILDKNH